MEENLIDVKKLLKQSTAVSNSPMKKGLVNLNGVEPYYKRSGPFDKTLEFESRFESGNLAAAMKVSDEEYHLLLQNDVNSSGHTQWFFFRVQNTKKYNKVRFNILNLSKGDSLYNEGMKILFYSEKLANDKDIGWQRGGHNIYYYQNGIRKEAVKPGRPPKQFYTLTFTFEFPFDDDTVFFAYSYPYTYSDMLDDLNKIMSDPLKQ